MSIESGVYYHCLSLISILGTVFWSSSVSIIDICWLFCCLLSDTTSHKMFVTPFLEFRGKKGMWMWNLNSLCHGFVGPLWTNRSMLHLSSLHKSFIVAALLNSVTLGVHLFVLGMITPATIALCSLDFQWTDSVASIKLSDSDYLICPRRLSCFMATLRPISLPECLKKFFHE